MLRHNVVEAITVGTLVPGGFNHAGKVLGKRPDNKIAMPGPPGWGLGKGLMVSHPCKKKLLLKPDTLFKIAGWWRSVDPSCIMGHEEAR